MRRSTFFLFSLLAVLFIAGNAGAGRLEQFWLDTIESGEACTTDQLMPKFKMLKPVNTDFMVGTWKGGKFDGGLPDPINWYGKRFVSEEYVEPLLVETPDGEIEAYDGLGQARMREVRFARVTSAALIYNNQPIIDYFRKVNDDIVIGFGETMGENNPNFFFYLIREE